MSDDTLNQTKAMLRRSMRERLRALTDGQIALLSGKIRLHLLTAIRRRIHLGGVIALYGGLRGEVDLMPLMPQLHGSGHRVVFFAIASETGLIPRLITGDNDLRHGALGAWEPAAHTQAVAISDLDLIVVPGLAFSPKTGDRLGRGGGFYDRLLSDPGCRALRVAAAFSCQLIDPLPAAPHDQRVSEIVTENGWLDHLG